ncbi:hypothetical protein [Teichococcus aestuarii]|uniref:hypothetical protein n=1 Tax=Teichococcus aestuarii TaxID=568898 RepID=UPI003623A7FA
MPIHHRRPARAGCHPVAAWQRQHLGHADRIRLMEAARRRERETYRRGSGRHGGELRETALRVLWTLLYRGQGRAGACDPALAQIAQEARLARSTVQEAVRRLEEAGILLRIPRGTVADGRWVQVTNAYLFRAPADWTKPSDTELRSASDSYEKLEEGQGGEGLWQGSVAPPASAERLKRLLKAVGWASVGAS